MGCCDEEVLLCVCRQFEALQKNKMPSQSFLFRIHTHIYIQTQSHIDIYIYKLTYQCIYTHTYTYKFTDNISHFIILNI